MSDAATRGAIEAVFRIEAPRLIAALARFTRDVGRAEDLAQDALVAALEEWPRQGVPENPAAWLMATAKHRAIDLFRRDTRLARIHEDLAHETGDAGSAGAGTDREGDDVGDDLLRLMFVACHPVLPPES
ncbi:MAG TPA: sigma factor, partial [Candidatus Polarisedimenticolia bacterium]|nr:sigma factor [Candidatus Polarisedimenticolia bacterium]